MKKIFVTLISVWTIAQAANAQTNTFPSTGKVGIGTTSPVATLDIQKVGAGSTAPQISITGYASNYSSTGYLFLKKSRTNILGDMATTIDGDAIGNLDFMGTNANSTPGFAYTARISSKQQGAAGTSYLSGKLIFSTSDAVSGVGERMTIDYTGYVGIGTSNPGVKLDVVGDGRFTKQLNVATINGEMSNFWGGITVQNNKATNLTGSLDVSGQTLLLGTVGIGTTTPDAAFKLSVNGAIRSKEIKVETGWSDYVFNDDYKLKSIPEVKEFIKTNHHLPDVPSAAEVEKNGVNLGETSSLLLKKIEELTLYIIEKDKQLEDQNTKIEQQNKQLKQQQEDIDLLKQYIKK